MNKQNSQNKNPTL